MLLSLKINFITSLLIVLSIFSTASLSEANTPIKISVLKFGTVNWTLETLKKEKLDTQNGFELIIQPLASTQAGKIALQANAANIIVSDWIWVARQRGFFKDYLFFPYSSSAGSIVVPKQSPIHSIEDLIGKKVGIAGGGLDKNWLLLRALALRKNINLEAGIDKVFGAPPLLNGLMKQGELDALINFWHYSARLKAEGYREIINTHGIIEQLGIRRTLPILGYVFSEKWAFENATVLNKFLIASQEAANFLCTSDEHWTAVLPLTRTQDTAKQQLLRHHYCAGRINHFSDADKQAIAHIYSILADIGGKQLVGSTTQFDTALFWTAHQP